MLVPDYDAADAVPSTEIIASSYRDVVEEVPWTLEFTCTLDPKALMEPGNRKYIRSGTLASNLDIKTYDGGNLFVCTVDGTAVNWGKLWVEYDVEFFIPQTPSSGGITTLSQHLTGVTPTSTDLLGTATTVAGSDSIVVVSGETLTFAQAGKFIVAYNISATTATVTANPAISGGGSMISTYVGNIASAGNAYGGSATATLCIVSIVNAVVGSVLTINNTVVAGLTGEIVVAKLGAAFT